jgi:uncharacterized Fe-S radical SAM superfamily protein PflX
MVLASRAIPPEVHGHGRFVIRAADFVPAYIRTYEEGRLRAKVEEALEALRDCRLCPRDCGVDRLANRFAVCKTGRYARVSSFFPHFGEEDVLRGWNGSGTIFFAWCNLRCVFCLSPEVRVITDRGALPIGAIFDAATGRAVTLGDGTVRFVDALRVYTHDGRLAPVAKVFRHAHRGELIVIAPDGVPALTVTANHAIFAAPAPGTAPRPILAGDLTERHVLFVPRRPQCWAPIRRIARVPYDGPVYNLEVADDAHSFLAQGVAVGNCQNFETSQIGEGVEVAPRDLARMMLQLQAEGCHNINVVTPEHVVPQILEALLMAVEGGLRLPLVYNTGAYDSEHSIRLMDGVVDIYMPDFKLWDRERSRRYLLAPDYPEAARRVIRMMHEQVGELKVNEDGLAVRGVLVRHLVMPGMLDDTRAIMGYLAGLSRDTYVNIMDQYYPAWRARTEEKFKDINRRITGAELEQALASARAAGLWRFDVRWRQVPRAAWGWG